MVDINSMMLDYWILSANKQCIYELYIYTDI